MHDRGAPPAGYVRQAPDHRVTRNALAPAASTPPILTSNTARQHCTVCLNALTRHLQPQVIQARERAQIRAIKDSIGHVEVFQMDGVGTPIIGRPRPLPGHDTPNPAHNTYTLKCEEPVNLARPSNARSARNSFMGGAAKVRASLTTSGASSGRSRAQKARMSPSCEGRMYSRSPHR